MCEIVLSSQGTNHKGKIYFLLFTCNQVVYLEADPMKVEGDKCPHTKINIAISS